MTPPASLQHWTRLRIRLVRKQTLRDIERIVWALVGFAALLYVVTRWGL